MPTPSPSPSSAVARIVLPAPPSPREPHPFPVLATIAPVVVALTMWAVTRSPFALMFAAFGPVMAIAGYVDAGLGGRRRFRAARARYTGALSDAEQAVGVAHDEERRRREAEQPSARAIVVTGRTDSRWRVPLDRAPLVTIGSGTAPSTLRLEGSDDAETIDVRERAARIDDVPVVVDARQGIGVVGPLPLARAIARGLVVQLAHASSPDALAIVSMPATGWDEFGDLPHLGGVGAADRGPDRTTTLSVEERRGSDGAVVSADVRIVIAASVAELPSGCREILECESALRVRWRRADAVDGVVARPDPVSAPDARRFAEAMAADAVALGVSRQRRDAPASVRLDELPPPDDANVHRLAVAIGATADGPLVVDLVGDGPHAVIGGTTGSGKSELLITWAAALASAATPEEVSLLLFDFKGGATFGALIDLPHVVGLVTDLDEATASRALESLRAELRHRERWLMDNGLRDVRDARTGAMPRLVIMVDEFAAMIETFPDLHGVFVDLAARGRSLGVHLVLCTQRPAAAVRDGVLANCDIRISLRVNNPGDSVAVVGTPEAASLPATHPGRVIASVGGGPGVVAQVATTTPTHVRTLADLPRDSDTSPVRRPWLDPLPAELPLESLARDVEEENRSDGGEGVRIPVGRFDLPGEQRQPVAYYRPADDGHLLVLGASGRGSTTLLEVIAAGSTARHVHRVPTDPEGAWDAVRALAALVRAGASGGEPRVVLLDDLDLLMSRWGDEYARAARDDLAELLRAGPAHGIHVVLTAHRATGDVLFLASLVGSTLRLGAANKHEHVLSGGESATYRNDRRPGSASWRGRELQVALPSVRATDEQAPRPPLAVPLRRGLLMIVTRRPVERARWARERGVNDVLVLGGPTQGTLRIDDLDVGDGPTIVVGDADAWQQQWALLSALRSAVMVVVEEASTAEFRSLTRRSDLPPWIAPGAPRAWLVHPDGRVDRVSFDIGAVAAADAPTGSRRSNRRVAATASSERGVSAR